MYEIFRDSRADNNGGNGDENYDGSVAVGNFEAEYMRILKAAVRILDSGMLFFGGGVSGSGSSASTASKAASEANILYKSTPNTDSDNIYLTGSPYPLHYKLHTLVDALKNFNMFLQTQETLRTWAHVLFFLNVIRLISFLRMQPRIALLYKTTQVAADDLFHFFVIFFIVSLSGAFVSVWRFGDTMVEYSSFHLHQYPPSTTTT